MVAIIIIPLIVTATVGIIGYLTYRLVIFDYLCNRSVNTTLQKYDIKKTQFEIIKEYYENKGESVSDKVIAQLAKQCRQKEPQQFLIMYDSVRERTKK